MSGTGLTAAAILVVPLDTSDPSMVGQVVRDDDGC
jgi:hypothetical protein